MENLKTKYTGCKAETCESYQSATLLCAPPYDAKTYTTVSEHSSETRTCGSNCVGHKVLSIQTPDPSSQISKTGPDKIKTMLESKVSSVINSSYCEPYNLMLKETKTLENTALPLHQSENYTYRNTESAEKDCLTKLDGTESKCDNHTVPFTCGLCLRQFESIVPLHHHMKSHGNGSYWFDRDLSYAFPRLDTHCTSVQTDWTMFTDRSETNATAYDSDTDIEEISPKGKKDTKEKLPIMKTMPRQKQSVTKKRSKQKKQPCHLIETRKKKLKIGSKTNPSSFSKSENNKEKLRQTVPKIKKSGKDVSTKIKAPVKRKETTSAVTKRKRGRPRKNEMLNGANKPPPPDVTKTVGNQETCLKRPAESNTSKPVAIKRSPCEKCEECNLFVKSSVMEQHMMKHRGQWVFYGVLVGHLGCISGSFMVY